MRTKSYLNKKGKLWLNVGSSYMVLEDYANLDNSPFLLLLPFYPLVKFMFSPGHKKMIELFIKAKANTVFLKRNCRKRLPFADNSVDHILCSHFLEHFYPEEVMLILKEFFRLLKDGGTLHVVVPDLSECVNNYILHKSSSTAADELVKSTTFSNETCPGFLSRFLQLITKSGVKHLWMYDSASLSQRLLNSGFKIIAKEEIPSCGFQREGVHLAVKK